MYISKRQKLIIPLITLLNLLSCSSPSEPDYIDIVYLSSSPVIKGFYVTTNEYPDGTGEVIGNPAYKINEINVFPNPYIDDIPYEINQLQRFVTFTHLPPGNVTIIIVKGISEREASSPDPSYFGMSYLVTPVTVMKIILKEGNNHFARWEFNNMTPSGYYRAYIFGDTVPENYFVDFSLTIKQLGLIQF